VSFGVCRSPEMLSTQHPRRSAPQPQRTPPQQARRPTAAEDHPSSASCPNRRHTPRAQRPGVRSPPPIYFPRTPPRRTHHNVTGDLSRATPQFAVREGGQPASHLLVCYHTKPLLSGRVASRSSQDSPPNPPWDRGSC
jgi:hypothetical protein